MTEKVQKTPEEIEQQAFLTGFEEENAVTGRSQPEPQKPESQTTPIKEEPPKQTPEAKKPEAKPKKRGEPKDEFVRLTKADYESLKTNAGRVPELEKKIETAFGKFGPLTQMINELKASTPKGQAVELPADIVSELEAEFPDTGLAGGVKAALVKALKGQIGTGKTDAVPEEVFKSRLEDWAVNRAAEDLEEAHPKWREIVGAVAKGQDPDSAHPFRAWLAKEPKDYQDKINNTMNPTVIANAITKFQASQREAAKKSAVIAKPAVKPKPSKKVLLRKNRIQQSVQPKGLGTPPPAQRQSEEDAFASGFRSG